jgi:hypothetical protein
MRRAQHALYRTCDDRFVLVSCGYDFSHGIKPFRGRIESTSFSSDKAQVSQDEAVLVSVVTGMSRKSASREIAQGWCLSKKDAWQNQTGAWPSSRTTARTAANFLEWGGKLLPFEGRTGASFAIKRSAEALELECYTSRTGSCSDHRKRLEEQSISINRFVVLLFVASPTVFLLRQSPSGVSLTFRLSASYYGT